MNRFFCFYTRDTDYAAYAAECQSTFAKFGVEVKTIPMLDMRNWMRNCMARTSVLLTVANEFPCDGVGLLDADLKCLRDPVLLKECPGDMAVVDGGEAAPPNMRYSAGVCVFGPTKRGRAVLKDWAARCMADGRFGEPLREQLYLLDAIEAGQKDGLVVTNLGADYNRHIDWYTPGDSTIILHTVASRKMRKKIGGGM